MGGEISFKNLKRNKKKYRTTVISIVVSVFVFIALSGFMGLAFQEVENEIKVSDFNISLSANITNAIPVRIRPTSAPAISMSRLIISFVADTLCTALVITERPPTVSIS